MVVHRDSLMHNSYHSLNDSNLSRLFEYLSFSTLKHCIHLSFFDKIQLSLKAGLFFARTF